MPSKQAKILKNTLKYIYSLQECYQMSCQSLVKASSTWINSKSKSPILNPESFGESNSDKDNEKVEKVICALNMLDIK